MTGQPWDVSTGMFLVVGEVSGVFFCDGLCPWCALATPDAPCGFWELGSFPAAEGASERAHSDPKWSGGGLEILEFSMPLGNTM